MEAYSTWVRANPSSARSVEQVLRTLIMLAADARSMIQFEGGIAGANVLSFVHSEILAEPQGFESTSQILARRLHRVLCEFQCVIELLVKRRVKMRQSNILVVTIEALKSLLILTMRWPNAKHQWRRAKAALLAKPHQDDHASPSGRQRRVIIPVVELAEDEDAALVLAYQEAATTTTTTTATWRDVARFVIDVIYLVRPIVTAWFALKYRSAIQARVNRGAGLAAGENVSKAVGLRGAWRVWAISLLVELALVIATQLVEMNATPLVSALQPRRDDDDAAEEGGLDSSLLSRRVRGLWTYMFRDPFFGLYLEGLARRWFINSWFVNTVPLIGGLIAFQANNALTMQKQSYLYTAGGTNSSANTAFSS